MSRLTLKIKIRSLAFEAAYIRRQSQRELAIFRKTSPQVIAKHGEPARLRKERGLAEYHSLYDHRMGLRGEQRASLLAYAWLRGRPYATVESPGSRATVNSKRIVEIIRSHAATDDACAPFRSFRGFDGNALKKAVDEWLCAPNERKQPEMLVAAQ